MSGISSAVGPPFNLIHKNVQIAKLIQSLFCRFEDPELLQLRKGFAAVWWMCSCISMYKPQSQHGFCPLNGYRSQSSNDPARTLIISRKVFYCENCYKPVKPDTSCANDFHGVLHFTDRENNASQTNSVQQQTLCWSTALLSLSLTVSVTVLFPAAMTQKKKPRSCRTLNFKLWVCSKHCMPVFTFAQLFVHVWASVWQQVPGCFSDSCCMGPEAGNTKKEITTHGRAVPTTIIHSHVMNRKRHNHIMSQQNAPSIKMTPAQPSHCAKAVPCQRFTAPHFKWFVFVWARLRHLWSRTRFSWL